MPASLKVSSLTPDEISFNCPARCLTVLEASSANSGRRRATRKLFVVLPEKLYWLAHHPVEFRYEQQQQLLHLFRVIEGHGGSTPNTTIDWRAGIRSRTLPVRIAIPARTANDASANPPVHI